MTILIEAEPSTLFSNILSSFLPPAPAKIKCGSGFENLAPYTKPASISLREPDSHSMLVMRARLDRLNIYMTSLFLLLPVIMRSSNTSSESPLTKGPYIDATVLPSLKSYIYIVLSHPALSRSSGYY